MEQWKGVVGYEGLYLVSDMGRIMKTDSKMLRLTKHSCGYVSMMCNAGVDLNVCSEMVGHTSPITTRVYNHVSKARLLNEAAKVIVS